MSKWEQYSEMVKTANKTNRSNGSIGPNAIVPRVVRKHVPKEWKVLDFGSGRLALHAEALRKEGYQVTAHEFGANVNALHDPNALKGSYEAVYMSNVLNVQGSREMMELTLQEAFDCLVPGGYLIANYPNSPRKAGLSVKDVENLLLEHGSSVRIKGYSCPVFLIEKE